MTKKYSKKILEQQNIDPNVQNKSYEIHTKAIDDLVEANVENSPQVPEEILKEYKKDALAKIPAWVKALFIKFWFNGAVCFFFVWGLGVYIPNMLDLVVVTSIAMGIITDLMVNNMFRFFDYEGNFTKWTMFPQKKFWTYFLNILYSLVIMFIIVLSYNGINNFINMFTGDASNVTNFMVEPFSFGALYLIVDLAFLGLKMFFKKLISDANKKLNNQK